MEGENEMNEEVDEQNLSTRKSTRKARIKIIYVWSPHVGTVRLRFSLLAGPLEREFTVLGYARSIGQYTPQRKLV